MTVETSNKGSVPENFTVTAYYDSTIIASREITNLGPGARLSTSFSWVTEIVDLGFHTIKAAVSILPEETSIEDNTMTYGSVIVVDETPPIWSSGTTLLVSGVTPTSVILSWAAGHDNIGIAKYTIYQGPSVLAIVPANVRSYNVTGLTPGTKYAFRVEAGDEARNWSTDGPSTIVTTASAPQGAPSLTSPFWQQYWYLIALGVGATVLAVTLLVRNARRNLRVGPDPTSVRP